MGDETQVVEEPRDSSSLLEQLENWGNAPAEPAPPEPVEGSDGSTPEPIEEPPAPAFDWDATLPDDPDLPEPYRNRMTLRELLENERNAVRTINSLGEEKNRLRSEQELALATIQQQRQHNEQLLQQLQQMQEAQKRQQQAVDNVPRSIWDAAGVNPDDIFDDARNVVGKPLETLHQEQMRIKRETDEKLASMYQIIQEQQRKEQEYRQEEQIRQQARNAWNRAREELGVDPVVWERRTPGFINHVLYMQDIENPVVNPEAYKRAYRQMLDMWGAGGQPPPQPPRKPNPPHATRTGTSTPNEGKKKLSRRYERVVAEFADGLEGLGLSEEYIRKAALARGLGVEE